MNLGELFDAAEEEEPGRGPRGRAFVATFALAVVTAVIGVVLLALLLYGLGVGGAAVWDAWWDDFT